MRDVLDMLDREEISYSKMVELVNAKAKQKDEMLRYNKKDIEKIASQHALEFSVDYKPFEEDLTYNKYAEYGYRKGFIDGYNANQIINLKL